MSEPRKEPGCPDCRYRKQTAINSAVFRFTDARAHHKDVARWARTTVDRDGGAWLERRAEIARDKAWDNLTLAILAAGARAAERVAADFDRKARDGAQEMTTYSADDLDAIEGFCGGREDADLNAEMGQGRWKSYEKLESVVIRAMPDGPEKEAARDRRRGRRRELGKAPRRKKAGIGRRANGGAQADRLTH